MTCMQTGNFIEKVVCLLELLIQPTLFSDLVPRLTQHHAVCSLRTGSFARISFDILLVSGLPSFQLAVILDPVHR